MNIEEALQALETQKTQFQSRIPAHAPRMRKRYLGEMVEEQIEAVRKHLQAIYQSHLEIGPNLIPMAEHTEHPNYAFWIAGIRRHLQECDAILAEQPNEDGGRAQIT